jgi:glycosyltransferase involved in cell wall biosynthesis
MYPGLPPEVGADGTLSPEVANQHGILMSREAMAVSKHFLVTSDYAAAMARVEAHPEDVERVAVIPFACPPPVTRSRKPGRHGLICNFGPVEARSSESLLLAIAALAREQTDPYLAFVGPVDDEQRARCATLAGELGIRHRVEVTGDVDDEAYQGWLDRCALAVQLTGGSHGETAFSVAHCLAYGVPMVVSDAGPSQQLTRGVVSVPHDAKPSVLAQAIGNLLEDPSRQLALADEGRSFAVEHDFEQAAGRLFELIVTG